MRTAFTETRKLRAERTELQKVIPSAMVMAEMKTPRNTFVLARGDYRNQGEKVQPGVPAILPPLPEGAPLNRLTLARWLVDAKHPLTARVAVNRFWQSYFGYGIVKTQEDFGVQGEPPEHPELLDWLATEFVAHRVGHTRDAAPDRDLGDLPPVIGGHRGAARARSRQPAAGARPAPAPAGRVDPRHRAGGQRSPERRRSAVRACCPTSRPACGKRWRSAKGFSAQSYVQSHGPDLYRRGMYTFWKRTVPPASLATFDAPDREKCTARRAFTNTPLQALTLMNDPTYVEAARALAQRSHDRGRLRRVGAHRLRLPSGDRAQAERQGGGRAEDLLNGRLEAFRKDRRAAARLVAVGESARDARLDVAELAAWTTVASAILNLDETITKQ